MNRPRSVAHHSSSIQSLYARSDARPTSRSRIAEKRRPAKPQTNEGKHNDAHTPLTFMSSRRARGSYTPRRKSSYFWAMWTHSATGRPEEPFEVANGYAKPSTIQNG